MCIGSIFFRFQSVCTACFCKISIEESANSNSFSEWGEEIETVTAFIFLKEENKKRNAWVYDINMNRKELGKMTHNTLKCISEWQSFMVFEEHQKKRERDDVRELDRSFLR